MPPLNPDDLAMRAFDRTDVSDLAPEDRATLNGYRRVIDASQRPGPPIRVQAADEDAPAGLWDAIASELFEPAVQSGTVAQPGPAEPGPAEPGPAELRARSLWTSRSTVVAIAAAAILLAGVLFAVRSTTSDPAVLAQAQLNLLPPGDPSGAPGSGLGTARLEQRGDRYDLVVKTSDVTALPSGDHYELWLLNLNPADAAAPLSLGVMGSPNGELRAAVPPGVDCTQFDVVDISVQANNGNHSHSGHSLLRGTLQ